MVPYLYGEEWFHTCMVTCVEMNGWYYGIALATYTPALGCIFDFVFIFLTSLGNFRGWVLELCSIQKLTVDQFGDDVTVRDSGFDTHVLGFDIRDSVWDYWIGIRIEPVPSGILPGHGTPMWTCGPSDLWPSLWGVGVEQLLTDCMMKTEWIKTRMILDEWINYIVMNKYVRIIVSLTDVVMHFS